MPFRKLALVLFVLLVAAAGQNRMSVTVDSSKIEWKPVEIPGVAPGLMIRELHSIPTQNTSSAIVRYPKGFHEPRHYHKQCTHTIYILKGRLRSPEGDMPAGTFTYAGVTEPHGPFTAVEETEILFHVDGPFDYNIVK
jgi:quercetin dioxygenase-like cupin family protein